MFRPFLCFAALFVTPSASFGAALAATRADVDAVRSSIVATFTQSGVPVESPFKRFAGRIVYDPSNVANASAVLEVETGSLDIGDEEYNAEVRKPQWFDVAKHPKATFRSTAIKTTGPDSFVATGLLTLKGKAQRISVPVTAKTTNSGRVFEGVLVISRKAFNLGDPLWESVLEDKVRVKFSLVSQTTPAR